MGDLNSAEIRYGGQGLHPVNRLLQAGGLSAQLMEDGSLRYIKFNDKEIIRSIYSAFRDENWGTVPVSLNSFEIEEKQDSFAVRFHAVHQTENIHFEWKGTIAGNSDGSLQYLMEGNAQRDFLKNRLGFCVLHPLEVAGTAVEVETDNGTLSDRFAELITPQDPFTHIKSMHYRLDSESKVSIIFQGDLFHTEDQRNWTDASYKTFCTPLDLPYPVKVQKGEEVKQSVTVRVGSTSPKKRADTSGDRVQMNIEDESGTNLPKIGTWFAELGRAANEKELNRLRRLNLSQLRVQLNLLENGWKDHLRNAAETAKKLGVELEIEALTDIEEQRMSDLFSLLFKEQISVKRLSPFPSGYSEEEKVLTKCELTGSPYRACQFVTKAAMLRHAKRWIRHYGLDIALGGGSRTNFTEFNRAVIPFDLMNYAEYALQPQTHAFDIDSIVETLEVQSLTVRTAKSILAESKLPLRIDSVTLKWRVNPYATSDAGAIVPKHQQTDNRLYSLFGGGWTIGSVRQLASEGIEAVNYYEFAGALGMMSEDGSVLYPVYHVLSQLGDFSDASVLPVHFNQPRRMEGIALLKNSGVRILAANLENDEKTVQIRTPFSQIKEYRLKVLDESNYGTGTKDFESWLHSEAPLKTRDGMLELTLRPFSICVLDGQINL